MVPPTRTDPLPGFNFRVEIDGFVVAAFTEVSGLASETQVVEYRTGDSLATRKLPGLTKHANIVLKRGITLDLSLWQWRKAIVQGNVDRRNGSIVLLDEARNDMLRFNFVDGWPCRWEGPNLHAGASDVAIETLEIAHEGLELGG
ncbi:MAG: phage tail protein [Actinobacteria bacterium]|nr:phage tail protein [Actinomycetota bacterium]